MICSTSYYEVPNVGGEVCFAKKLRSVDPQNGGQNSCMEFLRAYSPHAQGSLLFALPGLGARKGSWGLPSSWIFTLRFFACFVVRELPLLSIERLEANSSKLQSGGSLSPWRTAGSFIVRQLAIDRPEAGAT